jgi:uncharacterized protein YqeY
MTLKARIDADLKSAMKDKDHTRLEAIRLLRAAIQRREVDERTTLDDTQILAVAEKLVKQARESIAQFEQGGRADLAEKERAQIAVFEAYLPEQLGAAEVEAAIAAAIAETGAGSMRDMGKVMGLLKQRLQGQADMAAVSALVKQRLNG